MEAAASLAIPTKCGGRCPYFDQEPSIAATKLSVWEWETASFELDKASYFAVT